MKKLILPTASFVAAVLVCGAPRVVSGQLGSTPEDLQKHYGQPILSDTNESGVQRATFRKDNLDITTFARGGTAQRVIYRKPELTEPDVQQLLTLNSGTAQWTPWTPAGIPVEATAPTAWLRSDEIAMAVLNGMDFTFTAGEWNQLSPESTAFAVTTNAAPQAAASLAVLPPPPPAPPPPPKPKKPGIVPTPGDSRWTACAILGNPRGNIISGPIEILLYPWGQVTLDEGIVIGID